MGLISALRTGFLGIRPVLEFPFGTDEPSSSAQHQQQPSPLQPSSPQQQKQMQQQASPQHPSSSMHQTLSVQ
jgi:hypothetical protein